MMLLLDKKDNADKIPKTVKPEKITFVFVLNLFAKCTRLEYKCTTNSLFQSFMFSEIDEKSIFDNTKIRGPVKSFDYVFTTVFPNFFQSANQKVSNFCRWTTNMRKIFYTPL